MPAPAGQPSAPSKEVGGLRLTIVYDNTAYNPELTARWGFAAWIEYGDHTVLFDTGGDSPTLLGNMGKLGLDPQDIEVVVLSHNHGDHTDGLEGLLDTGIRPVVYVPASFPGSFKDKVRARTEVVEVTEPLEIYPGVHSTGEFTARIREQGLVVETTEGMVVITGCAHPGIAEMVGTAREIATGEIALVIGGFHLGDASQRRIEGILSDFREMGVRQVSPTHCTGEQAIAMFADEYGDGFVQGGVGSVVVVGPAPTGAAPEPATAGQNTSLAKSWPTGGWPTSTPEEQGMDSEMLAGMLDTIQKQEYAIDSVTVTRHGSMVADATIHPFRPDSKHIIHSCTKSIVSALIGITLDQGYIKDVQQPVVDLFPGRTVANFDTNKRAMTLEHLLTMTTGLECQDSYLYRWRGLRQMEQSEDWVQFMLDLPMAATPGTRFEYCNGASFLLSAIIQEATGMSALALAEQKLFHPLGISEVEWPANPQGISIGWGSLRMKPGDMAKIGYLYLNEGMWEGKQVVPPAWVEASTRKQIPATLEDGYGYQWWVDDSGYYMALGYAGQFIFVVPEQDMVVVFTSDLEETDFYVPQELLANWIIPAARSTTPLPDNPDGVAQLEARIQALASP
jgi:metal-dependent hydrolase (beta-lactamase superfamily II)/CubicO group peptidase (beta-lactamase class C family)